jgi:hypothetical protein
MSEDGDREKRDTLIAHSSQVQNPLLYPCWAGTVGTVLTVTNTEISLKRLYFLLGPLSSVLCPLSRNSQPTSIILLECDIMQQSSDRTARPGSI